MRTLIILTLLTVANLATAQIKPYQIKGITPYDTLWILGTDTSSSSITYGLGKWYSASGLGAFGDRDWLRYRTATVPNNVDTMYHIGIVTIGDDSTYSGILNVIGRLDLRFPDTTSSNIIIGKDAGLEAMSGTDNIGIGNNSLSSITSGNYNVGIGRLSLSSATTGDRNFGLGDSALKTVSTGSDNTSVGSATLELYDGSQSIAIGAFALTALESGNNNTAIGFSSGISSTTGNDNTFIGASSGYANETGNDNVMVGFESGLSSTGSRNVFLGFRAGRNETGDDRLYIENTNSSSPLVFGNFAADTLRVNGKLSYSTIGSTNY